MKESPSDIFVGIVAQKALMVKDGKLLCVRGHGNQKYDLPGGRLHKTEDLKEGLEREIKEELGCDCEVGNIVDARQMYHRTADRDCLFLLYEVSFKEDVGFNLAEDELAEYEWVEPQTISSETMWSPYDKMVLSYFNKQKL